MLLIKQNKKKSKDQNASEWNYGWKNRIDRSAFVDVFSEHLLTDKFRHLRMNSTSCYGSYIDLYTLKFYITYTLHRKHALVTSSYIDFYNSLQYMFFITSLLRNRNNRTREAVSSEKVFHWTKFSAFESQKFLSLKCLMKA